MIRSSSGNLLDAEVDALVNTVNTEGVMGKGIALQFKKAYPAMFEVYRKAAKAGSLRLGEVTVWETGQLTGPRYVINFPTKGHWKSRSKLSDIQAGLQDLVRVVAELGIESIAVPPLGCGNGGLAWRDVEPVIRHAFGSLPDVEVFLYAPASSPLARDMKDATPRPPMTSGRAALVEILSRYADEVMDAPGLIESQKLLYFLQVAGEPLKLRFEANRYGPYADNLRHVLNAVEGHFLSGYGDGSASVQEAESLTLLPGALEEATAVLANEAETLDRIARVLELAAGYESAYGLELLATVHWLAESQRTTDEGWLVKEVQSWSPRKARMFTDQHIRKAIAALRERGWLSDLPVAQPV